MKQILLPSDLSVQSLWPVDQIINANANESALIIHVIHMVEIPTSIHDLLFLGRNKEAIPLSAAFKDAISLLKNKYAKKGVSIQFDFVYGESYKILRNFMEGHSIEQIYLLDKYAYQFSHTSSVNFINLLKKSKKEIKYISFNSSVISDFQILSIFLNNQSEKQEEPQEEKVDEFRLSLSNAN